MKKLSKLMALLLSLLMIVSLFAACGEDKKDDDKKKSEETSASTNDLGEEGNDSEENETDKEDVKEDAASPEALLIGEWETRVDIEGIVLYLSLVFEDDGTAHFALSEENFNKMVDEIVALQLEDVTDEEIAEEGFASREEAEAFVKEAMLEETSYDAFVEAYVPADAVTWELDGDALTLESEDGSLSTAETQLSKGKTTFTLVNEESGSEMDFTKAK